MNYKIIVSACLAASLYGCGNRTNQTTSSDENSTNKMDQYAAGSFGYDLSFLKEKDSILVLKNKSGQGQLLVSPKYQAKVFTSTADGEAGKSFGWINYGAFDKEDDHMNAYGGEDRLWLGPEGGKFSLFFKPETKMEYANWHTPAAIDVESWQVDQASEQQVSLSKTTQLTNYAGSQLAIKMTRQIEILEDDAIQKQLGITLTGDLKSVGFKTVNTIINNGERAWDKTSGAPCLWSLDMFTPSPKTTIIIPYHEEASGKVATTDYFGEIPKDRITYKNGVLLFKADGKSRGKLGIPPQRVKPVAGSYAADTKVLTLIYFDIDPKGTYLNQEWTPDKDPFTGDAMNAYNDGPLDDGSQMGPFYEMESVSPAAFLKPGEKLSHHHYVFHFTGNEEHLNEIAQKVLGISLKEASF
ncbi:hypothetical protein GCM10023231_33200 [Olivibacter ginsenosidimutans]|uniref:DUF4380 domain-containing protein n=1 Tax=Olivibacter ginsenosidimutans TaxID=1176537 RepID=A0ABP9BZ69_9SPHI